MKFRIKITENNGKIFYTPQVKKSFFGHWKGLLTGCLSIYPNKYGWEVFNSEAEAIELIDKFKKQEFDNKQTITYKNVQ